MENLHQAFAKLREHRALSRELGRAKDEFAFKPFALAYRPLAAAAGAARHLLALFSVVTGWGCLYAALAPALPGWLAAPLAGLLLAGLEALKGLALGLGARLSLMAGRPSPVLLLALALTGASVFFSLQGVKSLYEMADGTGAKLAARWQAGADSLAAAHGRATASARADLEAYRKSVSWRGKIDMYNRGNREMMATLGGRLAQAEAAQRAALAKWEARRDSELEAHAGEAQFNTALWVGLSGTNELLILLAAWFGVYYRYRLARDGDLLAAPAAYHFTQAEVTRLLELASLHGAAPAPPAALPIGFKSGGPPAGGTTGGVEKGGFKPALNPLQPGGAARLRAFLAKYPQVVACVREGRPMAEVVRLCQVSESTVHNVKRCLRVLGELND